MNPTIRRPRTTRYEAHYEALVTAEVSKAIVDGKGADTERTRVLNIARNSGWAEKYTARVLRNSFLDQWRNRDGELREDSAARDAYCKAADRNDLDAISIWPVRRSTHQRDRLSDRTNRDARCGRRARPDPRPPTAP